MENLYTGTYHVHYNTIVYVKGKNRAYVLMITIKARSHLNYTDKHSFSCTVYLLLKIWVLQPNKCNNSSCWYENNRHDKVAVWSPLNPYISSCGTMDIVYCQLLPLWLSQTRQDTPFISSVFFIHFLIQQTNAFSHGISVCVSFNG